MANPQKENGNIQIATDIWEHLAKIRIPGEARQVLDWILRKTYGWNKKTDKISLSQFEQGTGLKKNTICKALVKLYDMKLITITQLGNENPKEYGFIKDFDKWKPLPKKGTLPNLVTSMPKLGKRSLPNLGTTIDTSTIDTTKDTMGKPPKNEVNLLLDFFKKNINDHINFGNKTEREACKNLINKYSLEKVQNALIFLEEKRKTDKYLPIITTPYELWTKWAKIKQHLIVKKQKIWTTNTSVLPLSLPAIKEN